MIAAKLRRWNSSYYLRLAKQEFAEGRDENCWLELFFWQEAKE